MHDLRKKLKQDKTQPKWLLSYLWVPCMAKLLLNQWEHILLLRMTEMILKSISYNYNYIDSVVEVNCKSYIIKVKPVLSHFHFVHCGVEILNMSKRIMNKVFSCADDCDIKIYYRDTDSIHLNYGGVDKTENGYKEKYGSELVGEELGNFHTDFSMDSANAEICAIGNLFLGKKTYIGILESMIKIVRQLIQSIIECRAHLHLVSNTMPNRKAYCFRCV